MGRADETSPHPYSDRCGLRILERHREHDSIPPSVLAPAIRGKQKPIDLDIPRHEVRGTWHAPKLPQMLPSLIQSMPWDAEANSIATALVNISLLQPNSPRESDEVRSVAHAHDWGCFPPCSRRFGKGHE